MRDTVLDARLASAAGLVRQGACFADIGTDHARLPLFLLSSGRVVRAYAADVARGPLSRAKEAIEQAGESRCETVLCDGAAALAGRGITDYAICGMGGELIARIISDAPQLRDASVRLILQPMTRAAHLRRYLAENGFRILREVYSIAASRPYVCLLAEFCGGYRQISRMEAEIGTPEDPGDQAFRAYARQRLRALEREAAGARQSGRDGEQAGQAARAIAALLENDQYKER